MADVTPDRLAALERIRVAAQRLIPDVRGLLHYQEAKIRIAIGNTNYAVVIKLAEELLAALDALPPSDANGWRPIGDGAPDGWQNYFLVRPTGWNPCSGKSWIPTVVQRVEGKFYTPDNEIEPIDFGQDEPLDSPLRTTLEWHSLPPEEPR